jgi:CDGSH-type Zn-finger protein
VVDSAEIVPYRDGPYLVRGAFTLQDQAGRPIPVSRRTIALCRCGKSRIRPFCDGTHRAIRFQAPSGAEGGEDPRPAPPPLGARRDASSPRPPAQHPRLVRAETELTQAERELRRLFAGATAPAHPDRLRRAASLIDAARRALGDVTADPGAAPARPSAAINLAPGLCLVRGAVAAMGATRGELERRIVARLEATILELEDDEDDDGA